MATFKMLVSDKWAVRTGDYVTIDIFVRLDHNIIRR